MVKCPHCKNELDEWKEGSQNCKFCGNQFLMQVKATDGCNKQKHISEKNQRLRKKVKRMSKGKGS